MITKYYLTLTVILSLNLCGSYTVTPSSKSSSISGKSDCKVSYLNFFMHISKSIAQKFSLKNRKKKNIIFSKSGVVSDVSDDRRRKYS